MKEPKNTKSITKIQEDELERWLNNLTFVQAMECGDLGITFEIDYKNRKVINVVI